MFEHDLKFTILPRILSIVATSVSIMRDISSFVFPLSVGSSYSSSFFPYPSFTFSLFKFPFSSYSRSTPTPPSHRFSRFLFSILFLSFSSFYYVVSLSRLLSRPALSNARIATVLSYILLYFVCLALQTLFFVIVFSYLLL